MFLLLLCFTLVHVWHLGPRSRVAYGDDKIKSEVIYAGERRYYLDLKENTRGIFLKVTRSSFILYSSCISFQLSVQC